MTQHKTFIIAEAGVNHNGSLDIAKKLIDAAIEAGADAVKFQSFKAENLVSKNAPKAQYQKKTTNSHESHLAMLQKLELCTSSQKTLYDYAQQKKIVFLSSAFDTETVVMLHDLGIKIFKIPSGEITNLIYLKKIGGLKKKVILSTGMANMKEIEKALNILTNSGTNLNNIAVLHCNTQYPTPMCDVNLNAMLTIKKTFGVNVGYSDHTLGIEVPIAAVAMGASIIEKHITLDKTMKGPDHKASIEPKEFKDMVMAIKNIEIALGSGIKQPTPSELKNKLIARKSIVAKKDIAKNELFTKNNLTVKRPGNGISPLRWDEVMDKRANRNFKADELIEL